jgi:hypothetical protein
VYQTPAPPTTIAPSALVQALTFTVAGVPCPTSLPRTSNAAGPAVANLAAAVAVSQLCQPPDSMLLNWTELSDPAAKDQFLIGGQDWVVTGQPITPADVDAAKNDPANSTPGEVAVTSYGYAPLATSSLVIGFRANDIKLGQSRVLTSLKMTPKMIAAMFTGQVGGLTDPTNNFASDLATLNPGIQFQNQSFAQVRSEPNADTELFMEWLFHEKDADPGVASVLANVNARLPAATDQYPVLDGSINLSTGAESVPLALTGGSSFTRAGFGLMTASLAQIYGLPTVTIVYPDGTATDPTDANVTKSLDAMTKGSDGFYSVDWSTLPETDYPLPEVAYVAAPTGVNLTSPVKDTLTTVLDFMLGPGQTTTSPGRLLPRGNVPLPDDMKADLTTFRDSGLTIPTTTTTTTTTSTTTTTTTVAATTSTSATATTVPDTSESTSFQPVGNGSGSGSGSGGGNQGSSSGDGGSQVSNAPEPVATTQPQPPSASTTTTTVTHSRTATATTTPSGSALVAAAPVAGNLQESQSRLLLPLLILVGSLCLLVGFGIEGRAVLAKRRAKPDGGT